MSGVGILIPGCWYVRTFILMCLIVFYMNTLHANFNIKYMYFFHCDSTLHLEPQGAICAPHTGDTHVSLYGMGWEAAPRGIVYRHDWCGAALKLVETTSQIDRRFGSDRCGARTGCACGSRSNQR